MNAPVTTTRSSEQLVDSDRRKFKRALKKHYGRTKRHQKSRRGLGKRRYL